MHVFFVTGRGSGTVESDQNTRGTLHMRTSSNSSVDRNIDQSTVLVEKEEKGKNGGNGNGKRGERSHVTTGMSSLV